LNRIVPRSYARVLADEGCPCCGQDLADATEEPDSASDARPGDRWCPNCRWLIIREIDDALDWPVDCPTHGPLSD
jgi:hypothetical protein